MSRGDELIESLQHEQPQEAIAELQTEVARGYPVERLTVLLRSSNPLAVNAGVLIASELGRRATPLLGEMLPLLDSQLRSVKFSAIDVVLVCAGQADGQIIAKAIGLIADSDDAVRWKAMQLLSRASEAQLGAAIPHLRDEPLRQLTAWLNGTLTSAEITARLTSPDQTSRLFAAAAAARIARDDRSTLDLAAALADTEVSSFAQEQQELLKIRRRR